MIGDIVWVLVFFRHWWVSSLERIPYLPRLRHHKPKDVTSLYALQSGTHRIERLTIDTDTVTEPKYLNKELVFYSLASLVYGQVTNVLARKHEVLGVVVIIDSTDLHHLFLVGFYVLHEHDNNLYLYLVIIFRIRWD